jgi:hypothetical protein
MDIAHCSDTYRVGHSIDNKIRYDGSVYEIDTGFP